MKMTDKLKSNKQLTKDKQGIPFWDAVLFILFMIGLGLIYWEVLIYRKTIIDFKILLFIFLIPGLFLTPFFYKTLNKIDGRIGHWILHYTAHTVIVGGFLMFGFMGLNYYGADNVTKIENFPINKKGSLPGGKYHRNERLPYAEIDFYGFEKQLVFNHEFENQMDSSTHVILYSRNGLLGFKILDKYELKK